MTNLAADIFQHSDYFPLSRAQRPLESAAEIG
jgi:hypothetical protein